ncbi:MAG: GPW/gp25 family protein [Planctomycetota bacterium]
MGDYLAQPFRVGIDGRTATALADDHVAGLIRSVLFTAPEERVNRPDFGCGLRRMLFAPNDPRATATQLLVHGALQRWLGDVIRVHEVRVESRQETLEVLVRYTRLGDGEEIVGKFSGGA